jgi:GATA-binding protein, other eukaryote
MFFNFFSRTTTTTTTTTPQNTCDAALTTTTVTALTGLYFKLHGTHRPNSMKKTVIKRRKRISNPSSRMSDQAAAEALVSVGRNTGDDSDADAEPKRKRPKRSSIKPVNDRHQDGDDDIVSDDEPERLSRRLSRDGSSLWNRSNSIDTRYGSPSYHPTLQRSHTQPHLGYAHPQPVLPSLNASLAPSSYLRAGSSGPTRTQSPLAHTANAYVLPPMHPASAFYPGHENSNSMPSLIELERHLSELQEQHRRFQEMVQKTEKMMTGVKRGIDEMRGAVTGQKPSSPLSGTPISGSPRQSPEPMHVEPAQESSPASAPAEVAAVASEPAPTSVPLPKATSESERPRESIWPITAAGAQ